MWLTRRDWQGPQLRFTSLAHLLDVDFLRGCYFALGRDRASGIDGVSWREYGEQLDENLENLVERMKAKRYKPQPAKRVYIPKTSLDTITITVSAAICDRSIGFISKPCD